MALTAYITATRRLLHDASGKYFSDSELTTYVNSGRSRIALDTGAVSGIANFYLSQSQESYPYMGALAAVTLVGAGTLYTAAPTITFTGGGGTGATATASITGGTVSAMTITANGAGFTAAPTVVFTGGTAGTAATATASIMNALDILSITVNYQNSWITLGYAYFSVFQAKARYYRSTSGLPSIWSQGPPTGTGGGRAFYIYQIPSQPYQCDIHCITTPDPLVDDTTVEQLTYPETDLVPYYAAYLAKYNQQMFDESANFLRIYDDLRNRGQAAKYQRRIPNPYAST